MKYGIMYMLLVRSMVGDRPFALYFPVFTICFSLNIVWFMSLLFGQEALVLSLLGIVDLYLIRKRWTCPLFYYWSKAKPFGGILA